ncbi:RpnC/YadD family protein [Lunatibacter salilacus]|uniref:hypothetical protein n=1 Tax=Lunatibacter salilacus TaxID=2483804 RepID=UPI00131E85B1|nr:hypothetical protein [Lunatibacter salilacus]
MLVVYALNVSDISEAQLGDSIKSIPEPIKENIMTTYDRLMEKWKLEGELIGMQKERAEGKAKVILNLFDEGFQTPRIAKIVEMREQEVVTILKDKGMLK